MKRLTVLLTAIALVLSASITTGQITNAKPHEYYGPPVRQMDAAFAGCCTPLAPELATYNAAPELLGDANHGCYPQDSWSPDPCPVAPTATAVPPVPTVAPPFEPKDIQVPGFFATIVAMLSPSNPLPIGWGVLAAGILTGLVALLRQGLAMFGGKLGPRGIFIVTTVLGALAAIGSVVGDGVIAGGDEWSALLIAVVSIPGAFFGYRLLFSAAAKERVK